MEKGNWSLISTHLKNVLNEIFLNYDYQKLSSYEKRKIIFEFLCNNLSYDYELFNGIKDFEVNKKPISRDTFLELSDVMNRKKGVCNAISQYYKLLLEEAGIIAYCVICDDGTEVKHQLNLVYDDYQKVYSFDDVTSVIVGRGTIEDYFDYNLEFANSVKQGTVEIMNGKEWFILPENFINYLVGRKENFVPPLGDLPSPINSVKQFSFPSK